MNKQLALFVAILLNATFSAFCAPSTERGEIYYNSISIFSTDQIEIGVDNLYSEFSRSKNLKNGFFTKGKVLNTMILVKKYPNASLDFLFPGIIIMGICFSAPSDEACGNLQDFANILNGEFGYKFKKISISLANGIHPFISDGIYHDSGVKFSIGGKHELAGYLYEQDRFGRKGIDFGVSLSYTFYGVPDEFIIK